MQQFRVEVCILLVAALLFLVPESDASELTSPVAAKWPRSPIVVSVSSSLSDAPNIQGDTGEALQKSIDAWIRAADVSIESVVSNAQSISPRGLRGDGVSLITAASTAENVRLFPKQADSPAAATRIFTDRLGNITEADIVLNPFVKFSTDGTFGTYDLQSTFTHELGHLLGLDHSPVWGSVMFGKTGASFGLEVVARGREALPEVDAAAVRSLYGPKAADVACCGTITGRLAGLPRAAGERHVVVWLEKASTGQLIAATFASADGQYEIGGVPEGTYMLRVAAETGVSLAASGEELIQVSVADLISVGFRLNSVNVAFSADLFGTSPQIARLPGRFRLGGFQSLFIGGKGMDTEVARVGISGTNISVGPDAFRVHNYPNSVKVISFDLPAEVELSDGEFSLVIEDVNGVRRFLVGALVVSH